MLFVESRFREMSRLLQVVMVLLIQPAGSIILVILIVQHPLRTMLLRVVFLLQVLAMMSCKKYTIPVTFRYTPVSSVVGVAILMVVT